MDEWFDMVWLFGIYTGMSWISGWSHDRLDRNVNIRNMDNFIQLPSVGGTSKEFQIWWVWFSPKVRFPRSESNMFNPCRPRCRLFKPVTQHLAQNGQSCTRPSSFHSTLQPALVVTRTSTLMHRCSPGNWSFNGISSKWMHTGWYL